MTQEYPSKKVGIYPKFKNEVPSTGTVTSVSVNTINGFSGTVNNPTTTPAINIQTTVTGVLKGNGLAVSAATGSDIITSNVLTITGGNQLKSTIDGIDSNTVTLPGGGATTNTLVNNNDNTLTSTVNSVASIADIITDTNTAQTQNTATLSVNGIDFPDITLVNTVDLSSTANSMTSTVNGVAATPANIVNSISTSNPNPNHVAATVNGVTSTSNAIIVSSISNSTASNQVTTTVNGVTSTPQQIVTSVSNSKSDSNHVATTVNGVNGTSVPLVETNSLSLIGTALSSTVNGVTSSSVNVQPLIASPTANDLVTTNGGGQVIDSGVSITTSALSNDNTHVMTSAAVQAAIASSPSGSVTSVSVVSANGFAGSVATPTSTPAITMQTTVTGILKGNGTAISAATGSDIITSNALSLTGTALKSTVDGVDSNTVNVQPLITSPTANDIVTTNGSGQVIDSGVSITTSTASNDNTHVMTSAAVQTLLAGKEPSFSVLPPNKGGTGLNFYSTGDLITANNSSTLTTIPAPAGGQLLASAGVSTKPVWSNNPSIGQMTFTNVAQPIMLQGSGGFIATITTNSLTGASFFTIPNGNTNSVVPSSAPANQFCTGISSAGVISYAAVTNTISSATNTMTSVVAGVSSNTSIVNSNALTLTQTSLSSSVNGVSSSSVSVSPGPQSITSSITFTNLDEIIILVAPLLNPTGVYELILKDASGNELDIVFSICANSNTTYNQSTLNILQINDSQGVVSASNISSYLLFRGYVRTDTPNSYFAVTMSMPYSLLYTNPLSLTVWQRSASYLNDNSTITALITTNISNLVSTAAPNLSFKMKLNYVPVTVSNPQGYLYEPSNTNVIFQFSINPLTGVPAALSPASVAMTTPYKLITTNNRNYLYAGTSGGTTIFMWRIGAGTGLLSALSTPSITTPSSPTGMSIDPTDRFLYACFDTAGTVQMYTITKATGILVFGQSVGATAGMRDCLVHPSGKFLYAFSATGTVVYQWSINPSNGQLTAIGAGTVSTGTTPVQMCIHPNGKYLYVACAGGTTIFMYAIDQTTGALTALSPATFTMASNPFGVTMHPNGNYIFVCLQGANSVVQCLVNPNTGLIVATGPSVTVNGARHSCFDYTGTYLYVINTTNNRLDNFIINASTGAFTANGNTPAGTNSNSVNAV